MSCRVNPHGPCWLNVQSEAQHGHVRFSQSPAILKMDQLLLLKDALNKTLYQMLLSEEWLRK